MCRVARHSLARDAVEVHNGSTFVLKQWPHAGSIPEPRYRVAVICDSGKISHPASVNLKGPAMNTRIVFVGFALLFATPLLARDKTDVLVMKNGDRMTCAVK